MAFTICRSGSPPSTGSASCSKERSKYYICGIHVKVKNTIKGIKRESVAFLKGMDSGSLPPPKRKLKSIFFSYFLALLAVKLGCPPRSRSFQERYSRKQIIQHCIYLIKFHLTLTGLVPCFCLDRRRLGHLLLHLANYIWQLLPQ